MPHPEKVLSFKAAADLIRNSPSILVDLVAGGIIIGLPLSIAAYWIALAAVEKYRRKIKPRLHQPQCSKAGGIQSQGAKGAAVVVYCKPLATPDLEPSGFPER